MDSGWCKKEEDLVAELKMQDIPFMMKAEGADPTGVKPCDDIWKKAIASGRPIYFASGTYRITYTSPEEKVFFFGDGSERTTLLCSYISIRANFRAENITLKCTAAPFIMCNSKSAEISFNKCEFSWVEVPKDSNWIAYISDCKLLRIINCKVNYGGIALYGCEDLVVRDSEFNMNWVNTDECIHLSQNCKKGLIVGNRFYNSVHDFIDFYSNPTNFLVEGNYFSGCNDFYMMIKAIYRDEDDGYGNETNKVGAFHNLIIRNNFFSGSREKGYGMFDFSTADYRTNKIDNNFEFYPKDVIFEGNMIDDTTLDGTSNQFSDNTDVIVFIINGMSNMKFLNNHITVNYGNKRFVQFNSSLLGQISENLWFDGNVISLKYGSKTVNPVQLMVNNGGCAMKNIFFRNNTVPEGSSINLNNSKSKIFDNIVFEGNLTDETYAPYGTVADQGIKLILAGNTGTLKVRCKDMKMQLNCTGGANEAIFEHCRFVKTFCYFKGKYDRIDFINCDFANTSGGFTVRFQDCTIELIRFINCIFRQITGTHLFNTGTIKAYLADGLVINSTGTTLWNTSGNVPVRLDHSSFYK